jgi:hypothetical protein
MIDYAEDPLLPVLVEIDGVMRKHLTKKTKLMRVWETVKNDGIAAISAIQIAKGLAKRFALDVDEIVRHLSRTLGLHTNHMPWSIGTMTA